MRAGPGGDRLSGWPPDQRIIVRRVPRPGNEQAKLGEHPDWRYGAFATSTQTGQIQWLDARHRTQAHVEDKMKEIKACGAENLPSANWDRNCAWLQLAALACSMNAWLRHLALGGELARAEPRTLRFRLLSAPARLVVHARRRILKIPPGWPRAMTSPQPANDSRPCTPPEARNPSQRAAPPRPERGNRRPPERSRATRHAQPGSADPAQPQIKRS